MHKYFTGLAPKTKRQAFKGVVPFHYSVHSLLPPTASLLLSCIVSPLDSLLCSLRLSLPFPPRTSSSTLVARPRHDASQAGSYGSFAISAIGSSIFPSTENGGGEQRRRNAAAVTGLHTYRRRGIQGQARHSISFVHYLLPVAASNRFLSLA
jgi:hypothetical protein|uniref:Uncharacterized protein n=1 Tax=Zea mays TaxID=4577 RepID=A0A804PNS3_MAIZE